MIDACPTLTEREGGRAYQAALENSVLAVCYKAQDKKSCT